MKDSAEDTTPPEELLSEDLLEQIPESGPENIPSSRRKWFRAVLACVAISALAVAGHDIFSVHAYERSFTRLQKALMESKGNEKLTVSAATGLLTGFPRQEQSGNTIVYTWRGVIHSNSLEVHLGPDSEVLWLDTVNGPGGALGTLAAATPAAAQPVNRTAASPPKDAQSELEPPVSRVRPKHVEHLRTISHPLGGLSKEASNVLVLDAYDPDHTSVKEMSGSLIREIGRQALLIAGREGLGLRTRDRMLREHERRFEDTVSVPFAVVTSIKTDGSVQVGIVRLQFQGWQMLWEQEFKVREDSPYEALVTKMEEYSRTDLETVLTKAGFPRQKPVAKQPAPISEELQKQLETLDEFSQYAAVRELHQLIKKSGETPERLGLLSRGYANLGALTRKYWVAAPKVFIARSLVYAERAVALSHGSAVALLDRAYARALTGLHRTAIVDLDAAAKAPDANKSTEPEWAPAIRAYALADDDALAKLGQSGPQRSLARFLRLLTLEFSGYQQGILERTQEVFEDLPGNLRASEILAENTGLAGRGQVGSLAEIALIRSAYPIILALPDLPAEMRNRIRKCRGLTAQINQPGQGRQVPAEVKKADAPAKDRALPGKAVDWLKGLLNRPAEKKPLPAAEDPPQVVEGAPEMEDRAAWDVAAERVLRRDLMRAFRESGKSFKDQGEPSLATLAYLLEERSFLQAYRRIEWQRNWDSTPVTDLLKRLLPVYEDHPYRQYLDLFGVKDAAEEKQSIGRDLSDSIDNLELEWPGTQLLRVTSGADPDHTNDRQTAFNGHSDAVLPDRLYELAWNAGMPQKTRDKLLAGLIANAPEARSTLVCRIRYGEESAKQFFRQWERRYRHDEPILTELAKAYTRERMFEDAERILSNRTESAPSRALFQQLAELYDLIGDGPRRLECLTKALQYPGEDQDPQNVNVQIARIHMKNGDYHAAKPFALAAAESGMLVAAEIHEHLEEWTEAEALYRAASEVYADAPARWYHWCLRTGHGDVDAARETAARYLATLPKAPSQENLKKLLQMQKTFVNGRTSTILNSWISEARSVPALRIGLTLGRDDVVEEVLKIVWQPDQEEPYRGFFGWTRVWLAQAQNNPQLRDATIAQLIEAGKNATAPGDREVVEFAIRIQQDFARPDASQLDSPVMERLINSLPSDRMSLYWYFLGKYLDARGRRAEAIRYMEWCAAAPDGEKEVPTSQLLAAKYLREHDRPIPKDRIQDAVKLTWPAADGASRILSDSQSSVQQVQFTADGKLLAAGTADGRVYFWDVSGEKPQLVSTVGEESPIPGSFQMAPDGKTLVIQKGNTSNLFIWDRVAGTRTFSLIGHGVSARLAAFSPDGKSLAVYYTKRARGRDQQGDITVWDLATRRATRTIPIADAILDTLTFLPDSQNLLAVGETTGAKDKPPMGFLVRFSTKDGKRTELSSERYVQYAGLAVSPDGEWQLSQLAQGRFQLRRMKSPEVVGEMFLSGSTGALALTPRAGSAAIGMYDGTIGVWNLTSGELQAKLTGHLRQVNSLAVSPDGRLLASGSDDLNVRLWDLARLPATPSRSPNRLPEKLLVNSLGMHFVPIHAGEFVMGENADFAHRGGYSRNDLEAERPQHRVQISRDYFLGQYEVTVRQFHEFVKATGHITDAERTGGGFLIIPTGKEAKRDKRFNWRNPGFIQTDDNPVVQVTWNDATAFCRWLSDKEKATYRLPTEAEWEYACRAGTDGEYFFELHNIIRYSNAATGELREVYESYPVAMTATDGFAFTAPVGSFAPNSWGLYDMHGNVFELCADWFNAGYYRKSPLSDPRGAEIGSERVQRGGSWMHHTDDLRSAHREAFGDSDVCGGTGFRVLREAK